MWKTAFFTDSFQRRAIARTYVFILLRKHQQQAEQLKKAGIRKTKKQRKITEIKENKHNRRDAPTRFEFAFSYIPFYGSSARSFSGIQFYSSACLPLEYLNVCAHPTKCWAALFFLFLLAAFKTSIWWCWENDYEPQANNCIQLLFLFLYCSIHYIIF